ncbi:aspartate ammonia-lyase [Salmonella enterica subsp. enterica serovar Heidelberg str. 622737-14]|nr:aspartate ammonia-lyase [Salmonella enterica subsp. enterica serovar Heidelberg str. 622737-14]
MEVNLGATAIGTGLNTPKEYSPLAVKNWLKSLVSPVFRLKI